MHWYFWMGLIASALVSVFTLPQLITIIKSRNTSHINIWMYLIYLIGSISFFIGGCLMAVGIGMHNDNIGEHLSSGLPLIFAQGICSCIASTIFGWKIRNKWLARKAHLTEEQFCKNAKTYYDQYQSQIKSIKKEIPHPNKEENGGEE